MGLYSINSYYYDVKLRHSRLAELAFEKSEQLADNPGPKSSSLYPNLRFIRMELENAAALKALFSVRVKRRNVRVLRERCPFRRIPQLGGAEL